MRAKKFIIIMIFILLAAVFLAACRPIDATKPGKAVTLTGDPVAGKLVYTGYCKSCHGDAGAGGVVNPGSDDGTVPELAPIDMDFKTVAAMDLVIEHGSQPQGADTVTVMPAFGDEGSLQPQQIADVIAYVLSLNK